MTYKAKLINIPESGIWNGNKSERPEEHIPPYIFSEKTIISIDVALATGRPILVSGPPGCGKTTLARVLSEIKGWNFLKYTFTSKSHLGELTSEIDQLKRLHDANAAKEGKGIPDEWAYQKPGIFWWAFNAASAENLGEETDKIQPLFESKRILKPEFPGNRKDNALGVVVLLDEIDKAEPDLPNDLLEPLDTRQFKNAVGKAVVAPSDLETLVIITTNGERELPPAFLRRCIHLNLTSADINLIEIAKYRFNDLGSEQLYGSMVTRFEDICKEATAQNRRPPGTSEFLDAINACIKLDITPEHDIWQQIEQATLKKGSKDA